MIPVTQATVAAPARTQLEFLLAQLHAIDAWHRVQHLQQSPLDTAGLNREMRIDGQRRIEGRRRERAALIARVDEQLRVSGELLAATTAARAVIAHRNKWLREKVAARLHEHGVAVVGIFGDGADAAGTIVAEQPDLVLAEELLPTLSGLEVVRRTRTFAPLAVVGSHVADSGGVSAHVDGGAHAVFTRRIPPAQIADQLVQCMAGNLRPLALV